MDDLQFRLSASRTIARPQFRELVQQRYFDPETNRSYRGNPFLVDSELTNFEARLEYYFGGASRASLAGFYKDLDSPVEAYIAPEQGTLVTGFANAPKATLYGAEVDVQYSWDLIGLGSWFASREIVVVGNYTYTNSELSVSDGDVTIDRFGIERPASLFFVDGAPMVGQSDHIANVQLSLQNRDMLEQLTVLVSYASERVTIRGANGRPDVIEDPGLTVDLVMRQGFDLLGQEAEFKFEVRNIFGRAHEEFQENENNRIEINTYDVGTKFGASLSVTF
jgi:outer membrane receptor protein involved in Fe transport